MPALEEQEALYCDGDLVLYSAQVVIPASLVYLPIYTIAIREQRPQNFMQGKLSPGLGSMQTLSTWYVRVSRAR